MFSQEMGVGDDGWQKLSTLYVFIDMFWMGCFVSDMERWKEKLHAVAL